MFSISDFKLSYVSPPTIQTNIPSIYQTLSRYFPVGAAVDTGDLSGPHAQLLTHALQQHHLRQRLQVEQHGADAGQLQLDECGCRGWPGCLPRHEDPRPQPRLG